MEYKVKDIFYKESGDSNIEVYDSYKRLPTKGNLVYEYNPLRNYRLSENRYLYNNKYYTSKEIKEDLHVVSSVISYKKEGTKKAYFEYTDTDTLNVSKKFTGIQFNLSDDIYIFAGNAFSFLNIKYNVSDFISGESSKCRLVNKDKIPGNYILLIEGGEDHGKYVDIINKLITKTEPETSFKRTNLSNQISLETLCKNTDKYEIYGGDTFYRIKVTPNIAPDLDASYSIVKIDDVELFSKDSLVDFITDELKFDINHPVEVTPQYSYDGSVNLILNDGKNKPKMINTRFSPIGLNQYLIVDRKGNNDTNIYDLGDKFELSTSLYKLTTNIPSLEYFGTFNGGNLKCGNYHFYFTYSDADGNESDFFAESGLVSIFIGDSVFSIRLGLRDENSYKGVRFRFKNLDAAYNYINVYYSRSSGDIYQNPVTTYHKIVDKHFFSNANVDTLLVTGYEQVEDIAESDINVQYHYIENAETQCINSNILFLGNVLKTVINYVELLDLSLHFLPYLDTEKVSYPDGNYVNDINTYYNSRFIYNYTGYWPEEIYRIGIVYILLDGSLSPVFNIRGKYNISDSESEKYTKYDLYDSNNNRKYIGIDENSKLLLDGITDKFENSKGVCSFRSQKDSMNKRMIYGIKIRVDDLNVINELKKYVKGYFFVRLKRIPTTLCLALSFGYDRKNYHPSIPIGDKAFVEESFLNAGTRLLSSDYSSHIRWSNNSVFLTMICPDYDVNYPYLNNLFNGNELVITKSDWLPKSPLLSNGRHYSYGSYGGNSNKGKTNVNIIGLQDSTPLVAVGDTYFSGVAGVASMGYKFDYIDSEIKQTEYDKLIRGVYGPFLGCSHLIQGNTIYNIKIPGYNENLISDYFKIRMDDKDSFMSISDRYSIYDVNSETLGTFYRGDCYLCTFTHRINRNFNDDTAPYNSLIVNSGTWVGKYNGRPSEDDIENDEELEKYQDPNHGPGFCVKDDVIKFKWFKFINLGDINAVGLGQWVTFLLRSSINLNIRALDESDVTQVALTGHAKGFYPNLPMSVNGEFKHEEALCYNKGYEKSVSERYNFELPDVPAIKNIFRNRILYSNVQVTDAFANGCRVFKSTHYVDYPYLYGLLTKIISWNKSIIAVYEHGVVLLSVNERNLINDSSNVYIETGKVLPDKDGTYVISDTFGSQWKDSVIKTHNYVYGVDTVARKIWRTNGLTIECISDFRVQKYLNDNISLLEREMDAVLGIRNVKTHYNDFKHDVMFTFYDNLSGIHEKAWNLCWNENSLMFVTFYSWIPSFSENIYNVYFSFDRLTSKWIAKLGQSNLNSTFSLDIVLEDSVFPNNLMKGDIISEMFLNSDKYSDYYITDVTLEHDNLLNYKKFKIYTKLDENGIVNLNISNKRIPVISKMYLKLNDNVNAWDLCSELFERVSPAGIRYLHIKTDKREYTLWNKAILLDAPFDYYRKADGNRVRLAETECINKSTIAYLLNLSITYYDKSFVEHKVSLTICVMPKYNMLFLTTDFWKHGQAGIIDITDKIKPTLWYGKQHPFEFEFIVNSNYAQYHKIFDNLIILSNKAAPESFHYEILGENYDFSWEKPNMYFRQEATEAFYQYHGSDIEYDTNFYEMKDQLNHKIHLLSNGNEYYNKYNHSGQGNPNIFVKSSLFPLYYSRTKGYDLIESYYYNMSDLEYIWLKSTEEGKFYNYQYRSGAEIVWYPNENEFRIWNHVKAVDIKDAGRRLRANMEYKESKWYVQIPPLEIVLKNEPAWANNVPPIVLSNSPIPDDLKNKAEFDTNDLFPQYLLKLGYRNALYNDLLSDDSVHHHEYIGLDTTSWPGKTQAKMAGRYIKIRIRYSGRDLALIQSVLTLFRVSYS